MLIGLSCVYYCLDSALLGGWLEPPPASPEPPASPPLAPPGATEPLPPPIDLLLLVPPPAPPLAFPPLPGLFYPLCGGVFGWLLDGCPPVCTLGAAWAFFGLLSSTEVLLVVFIFILINNYNFLISDSLSN
jgi:hypothetical protein